MNTLDISAFRLRDLNHLVILSHRQKSGGISYKYVDPASGKAYVVKRYHSAAISSARTNSREDVDDPYITRDHKKAKSSKSRKPAADSAPERDRVLQQIEIQHSAATAAGGRWISPLQLLSEEEGESEASEILCMREFFPRTLLQPVLGKVKLDEKNLFHIVNGVWEALEFLHLQRGVALGNLKLENVLYGEQSYETESFFLTDFRCASDADPAKAMDLDLACLGRIIYQLANQSVEPVPFEDISLRVERESWKNLDRKEDLWKELCRRLLAPLQGAPSVVRDRARLLTPLKPPRFSFKSVNDGGRESDIDCVETLPRNGSDPRAAGAQDLGGLAMLNDVDHLPPQSGNEWGDIGKTPPRKAGPVVRHQKDDVRAAEPAPADPVDPGNRKAPHLHETLAHGRRRAQDGYWGEAITSLLELRERHPDNTALIDDELERVLAIIPVDIEPDSELISILSKAANRPVASASAMFLIGRLYRSGAPKTALQWLHQANQRGHGLAATSIGVICELGCAGSPADSGMAMRYYEEGAKHDDPEAFYRMALLLLKDNPAVSKDPEKAVLLLRHANKKNYFRATNVLGECYATGNGTERDDTESFHCFSSAWTESKKSGAPYYVALFNMGLCLAKGRGIPRDPERAVSCFRLGASDGNHVRCMEWLAYCLREGVGVAVNREEAEEWENRANSMKTPR